MTMEELAHYGRWFPDEGHSSPLWWFDARRGEMLPVEAVCRACGCERAEDLDVEACKAVDIIPCFQVDVPALERKYACAYIFEPQRTALLRLGDRALDREFGRVIEANGLARHWYAYELRALTEAAQCWQWENKVNAVRERP